MTTPNRNTPSRGDIVRWIVEARQARDAALVDALRRAWSLLTGRRSGRPARHPVRNAAPAHPRALSV